MKRLRKSLALGFAIGLLGILITLLPQTAEIEEDLELSWLFHLRGPVQAPSDVVVVAIDEQTAQKLGLPEKPREWPRELHARLVDKLAQSGAKVVGFDLTFDTPSRSPDADRQFAAMVDRAANVVLVDSLRKETVRPEGKSNQRVSEISIEKIMPPIAELEHAATAHAPFPLPKESRVNTYWTFKSGAGDSQTLPVAALQIYAFEAYRDFIALLHKADGSLPLNSPARAKDLVASADGGGLILKLRAAFARDVHLGDRVLSELETDPQRTPEQKRLIRALVGLYRSGEVAYVNFYGPPRTITTIAYHDVLGAEPQSQQKIAPRSDAPFKGKAVFVGFSAFSQPAQDRIRDDYRTVFSQQSGLDISGVEIAATAFANLLEDQPLRPVPFPVHLAIVALWGIALGAGCRLLRPAAATLLVVALSSLYVFIAVREFGATGVWLPLLVPLGVQAPLALFGGTLVSYRDAKRERKRIKEAFGYFLSDKIVDRIVESVGPLNAADQLVYGACLATDVEKYTTLAETMSPRELGQLMNEYYAEMFKPVERLGGMVNEVVGDAMLAIWAASSAETSLRRHACEAAIEIFESLERFNQARAGKPALVTRFGLHSGQLFLGSIGASKHYEYQATGDMVNTASRIEGLSKYLGTRILASEATLEGLSDFLTRRMGSFLLVGKTAAVPIVELGGRIQNADPKTAALYERFAIAFRAYESRRWEQAARLFSQIIDAFPNDGPSQFYLRRCEAYVQSPPDDAWDPTVRLEHK